jgi:hypothetical protein
MPDNQLYFSKHHVLPQYRTARIIDVDHHYIGIRYDIDTRVAGSIGKVKP